MKTRLPAGLLVALGLAAAGCPPADRGCPSGQEECGGLCVDPASYQTDASNCGGCGVDCGTGTCAGGVCLCEGVTRCDALVPRCRDLQTDPGACGDCANACPRPGEGCAGGSCQCVAPLDDDCVTFCTDTLTDERNCGPDAAAGCGHACTLLDEVCQGGACACPASHPVPCPAGIPPACVNTQTDASNCGSCGNDCPLTNDVCVGGGCTCPTALPHECGATCVDRDTDEQNCGTCANVCATGATCTSATCRCPAGPQLGCGGSCCPAGNACCGSGCQTTHSNGLGQSFFDCNPLGTRTLESATAAARAWNPEPAGAPTSQVLLCASCLGWETTGSCAVWCYGGDILGGRVHLNTISSACLCPFGLYQTWN